MKYTQSSLPYITLLIALIMIALLDASGSVQTTSVIEIDLSIADREIAIPVDAVPSTEVDLITQNQ